MDDEDRQDAVDIVKTLMAIVQIVFTEDEMGHFQLGDVVERVRLVTDERDLFRDQALPEAAMIMNGLNTHIGDLETERDELREKTRELALQYFSDQTQYDQNYQARLHAEEQLKALLVPARRIRDLAYDDTERWDGPVSSAVVALCGVVDLLEGEHAQHDI